MTFIGAGLDADLENVWVDGRGVMCVGECGQGTTKEGTKTLADLEPWLSVLLSDVFL